MERSTRRMRVSFGMASVCLAGLLVSCAVLGIGDGGAKRDAHVACAHQRGNHASIVTSKRDDFPAFCADVSHDLPSVSFQVCDSTAADLNGDGRLEFLAADHIKPAFGYFLNDPKPSTGRIFRDGVKVSFVDGANSAGIVASDYNLDGRIDVANSNHPGSVTVRINETEDQSFDVRFPQTGETDVLIEAVYGPGFGIAGMEGGLVSADFNGDGRPDIATADLGQVKRPVRGWSDDTCPTGARPYSLYTASVMLNTSERGQTQASYADPVYFPIPGAAISIATADFNLDGKNDLVTANTGDSSISILTNHTEDRATAPCFSPAQTIRIPAGELKQGAGSTNPITADFNADGKADIATANWNIRTVTVWINTTPDGGAATPSFSEQQVIPTGDFYPLVLRHGDLDGDGLEDIVAIPLSTLSRAAILVLRNETERGSAESNFVYDAVYDIPGELPNDWLYSYFTTAGVVDDFDGDGRDDVAVVIAKASSLIRMMKPGNDILKYVDPGVPLPIVHAILPSHSMLVVYKQIDATTSEPPLALASVEPARQHSSFCRTARDVLGDLARSVAAVGDQHEEAGAADNVVRSEQAAHMAERLREVAAAGEGAISEDLGTLADFVDEMSEHVLTSPSKHVDHDIEPVVIRATQHLFETCGD